MPYTYITGLSSLKAEAVTLSEPIDVPLLVLKIQDLVPRVKPYYRAGYAQAVSQTNIGPTYGQVRRVSFGQGEIELPIPAFPYQVRFIPRQWVTRWELKLYSKDKAGPDGQAIANAPTPEQSQLLDSLGLTGLETKLSIESFQLVTAILQATTEKGRYARTIGYTPNLTPVNVLEPRGDRSGATLYNSSDKTIYVGFDNSLTAASAVEILLPGGQWVLDGAYIGPIWMLGSGDGTPVSIVEYANKPFN